jgi:hypothetical protein
MGTDPVAMSDERGNADARARRDDQDAQANLSAVRRRFGGHAEKAGRLIDRRLPEHA